MCFSCGDNFDCGEEGMRFKSSNLVRRRGERNVSVAVFIAGSLAMYFQVLQVCPEGGSSLCLS